MTEKKIRLAYLVSHPIQYQAPLLRRIAQEPDIDLTVFYGSDFSVRGYQDEGFGVDVKWDIPLLDGYQHEFLPALRDNGTASIASPLNYGILNRLKGRKGEAAFDALWVHGYSTVNALHAILAAKSLGIPVLLRADIWLRDRVRSGPKLLAKQFFFRYLKQFVDGVLLIGTLNKEYWEHYFGKDVPMFLLPYAVDNDYFQSQSLAARDTRAELLSELSLEAGRPIILFASKLQRRKRCSDLVEAFKALLQERGQGPKPYLLIVGDGEERSALEEQCRVNGISDDVRFCGFRNQSQMPRFFDICTVFVLPSQHEPWGLIVNEVMNAGRPVILSDDVGCHPDLITNGVEGFIFPVGDVGALTTSLRRVLTSQEIADGMGQRALERINQWGIEENVRGLRRALSAVTRKINA